MGKGRPRAVEKGVLGHSYGVSPSPSTAALPQAPVFYPTEEEFKDPLEFIYKIRPQAEPFGICRIVPPKSWNPPFALDRDAFSFPTKTQDIHHLQARPPSCDPKTFDLEYGRFLEDHLGKKQKRRVVFEGDELDLCRLFNAVKRYGGYDKVCKEKRWGDVARFVRSAGKISECAKHVLSQLYLEHLYDYEEYNIQLDRGTKKCKRVRPCEDRKISGHLESPLRKRRKNSGRVREKEAAKEALDQICEQCKSGSHGEVMLLCDRCDKGWHVYCLSPPLESVPAGNWYCLDCVNSDKDSFGFVPGKQCSLETFRRMDDRTRRKWFGQTNASRVQIEKRFWEIVEGKAGEVEVMYGSDLDTSMYGSGFPRANDRIPSSVDPDAWREYVASPWNLNNFPKLPGSMLRVVHENIAGVMVPWLYVGMLFSSFCWHVEDHCFYSINYLHWGEPKCWYGVPGTEANAFEQVMRNALPDLFEVQPDLLFQLVTMLNPSVLQENGVPVYGVLQEPGNFVITFPRSYHGGFNFGLNCAEAVNFAPADWLPHGGFGAELYRLYRKSAVLSHEELLYAVSKNGCDTKALPYLEEEMRRVFAREKRCREELWINGVVRSSLIHPKKHPTYVGTEEDPTCIICQQYLYLSAVTCSCRPSAFVCLEHWKHLCECNANKHQLLYRHTLAQLGDLVHMVSAVPETTNAETSHSRRSRWHHLVPNASSSMMKKVKGSLVCYAQLAEDWLSNSCHIFEIPFSNSAYASALKEAEQFLWADHDMDPVRDMANKLIEAQKWAMNVNSCLSKVNNYLHCQKKSSEKVMLSEIEQLLSFYPLPCYEHGLTKLKAYAENARMLIAEIESALSSCFSISKLEVLYTRATGFPIDLENIGTLACVISSAKNWLNEARECLLEKKPGSIEFDLLNKLKSEMLELHVQLPEMDLLLNLCGEAESWQIRCEEILKGPLRLKELEDFLRAANNVTVSIPQLKLLRQYCYDAQSWISHLHDILLNLNDRRDHGNIVRELSCILKAGESLRVHVDELPLVEAELKRSSCREKASKALSTKMPLEFFQQVLTDASLLEIENEQLFMEISKELIAAVSWEERAKSLLGHAAQISDFENIIRAAEDIFAILPSLPDLKDALSAAHSWISRCQPYLEHAICHGDRFGPLLQVDDLKELVSQSKLLKVTSDASERLQSILKEVDEWEHDASSLLQHSKTLLYMHNNDFVVDIGLLEKIKELLDKIDSTMEIGQSLGFEFKVLLGLKDSSLILQWSLTALSFCSRIPLLEEVDSILEDVNRHSTIFSGSTLAEVLIRGTSWLRKALIVLPESQISKRCKLKDVEQILEEIQDIEVPYPMMVAQLQNAIDRHESWIKQVHSFFGPSSQQSWTNLLKLKECGQSDAFDCPELDKVAFETEKVEKWMFQCHAVVEPLVGDLGCLSDELEKIKGSLDRALCIYHGSRGYRDGASCVCCPDDSENEEVYICLTCEDRYHFSCMGPPLATAGMTNEYSCPFCLCIQSGAISRNGGQALICRGNRPELKSFIEFLSTAGDFYAGIKELALVQEIVEKALECKSYLTEIVKRAIFHHDKDLSSISDSLLSALKAISVAGVFDQEGSCNLESALSRNSWKIRVKKLLRGSEKPVIQQIQRLVKEGLAISTPSEDHFMQEITKVKQISLQWVDIAKQIISDSGDHELSEVFKVMSEGESLPVCFEKELKLLKSRSTLYCICRKPYDQRAMIACDQCDEWYHFDCINLHKPPPKNFYCPACQPVNGEFISLPHPIYHGERSSADGEPPTPPACHNESKRRHPKKVRYGSHQKAHVRVDLINFLRSYSDIDHLWRENKRPLHRTARRRRKFEGLSCYFQFQHVNE
ncbi:lysine-specific demethylase JMJ17 [Elaeis guineensis]|uniref:Lysine-specific demethylase 5D n=1 Tax=Elaeis guineensis var. tenera TaxID=51953 RepID=A0A6I9S003_ELAGV|nr:lysine-specific demethylase 5D [Elaeis guineensis]